MRTASSFGCDRPMIFAKDSCAGSIKDTYKDSIKLRAYYNYYIVYTSALEYTYIGTTLRLRHILQRYMELQGKCPKQGHSTFRV